jgi:hypothetical protein
VLLMFFVFVLFFVSYYVSLRSEFRVMCVFFLRTVVYNTYCVVFLFCFLGLVYPMLPVSLCCSLLFAPLVFSNVHLDCHSF